MNLSRHCQRRAKMMPKRSSLSDHESNIFGPPGCYIYFFLTTAQFLRWFKKKARRNLAKPKNRRNDDFLCFSLIVLGTLGGGVLYYLIRFTYDFLNILGRKQQAELCSKCTDYKRITNDKVLRFFVTPQLQCLTQLSTTSSNNHKR